MPHIIHISDTHCGAEAGADFAGALVLPRLRRVIDAIGALEFTPDAIIHTGDIVDEPSEGAYRRAAREMARFGVPVYYARGNHDNGAMMLEHLAIGERVSLADDVSPHAYRIELDGSRIFVLDGCDVAEGESEGRISDGQMKAFAAAVKSEDGPFSVFLHYPPLAVDCAWIDKTMLLREGEQLHALLAGAGSNRVRGVFFGHVHSGVQIVRDGILYSSVGSTCCRIHPGRGDEEPDIDPAAPICFNHLSFFHDRLLVREYALSVSGPEG